MLKRNQSVEVANRLSAPMPARWRLRFGTGCLLVQRASKLLPGMFIELKRFDVRRGSRNKTAGALAREVDAYVLAAMGKA